MESGPRRPIQQEDSMQTHAQVTAFFISQGFPEHSGNDFHYSRTAAAWASRCIRLGVDPKKVVERLRRAKRI